ncbi:MAG TPA: hypothetical protein VKW77_03145, partial [Acidimicrobiales bacterium]|nr:hypothetical protein [Acidimicrobiales bacterium]
MQPRGRLPRLFQPGDAPGDAAVAGRLVVRHALCMAGSTDERAIAAMAAACAGQRAGVDQEEVASLVRLALELGATPEQVAGARDVGVLVLDRRLRVLGEATIGEAVAECGA